MADESEIDDCLVIDAEESPWKLGFHLLERTVGAYDAIRCQELNMVIVDFHILQLIDRQFHRCTIALDAVSAVM